MSNIKCSRVTINDVQTNHFIYSELWKAHNVIDFSKYNGLLCKDGTYENDINISYNKNTSQNFVNAINAGIDKYYVREEYLRNSDILELINEYTDYITKLIIVSGRNKYTAKYYFEGVDIECDDIGKYPRGFFKQINIVHGLLELTDSKYNSYHYLNNEHNYKLCNENYNYKIKSRNTIL